VLGFRYSWYDVRRGERARIVRQTAIIEHLKDGRHDTSLAEGLLAAYLTTHERLFEHRRLIVATINLEERRQLSWSPLPPVTKPYRKV
jgi:hypothetical protein